MKNRFVNLHFSNLFKLKNPPENNKLVIIFQMGKVASRSVCNTIVEDGNVKVYHLHNLNYRTIQRTLNDPINKNRKIVNLHDSLDFIDKYMNRRSSFSIISMVRDPVARNISDFFQTIYKYVPDEHAIEEIPVNELINVFLDKYTHRKPLIWFDNQMKKQLGIDVFKKPFDKDKGYQVINSRKRPLLIFKTEISDDEKLKAINDFLDIKLEKFLLANVGSLKHYKNKYEEFLQIVELPDSYLETMYNSKLVTHFYTKDEIEAFRNRWKHH